MIALSAFLGAVEAIRALAPVYREGGSGLDGTCDCVGLIIGAMRRCGHARYPMHSSNYFARYQMAGLCRAVSHADELSLGEIVYKARDDQSGLNARYLAGGRYDTGDVLDYYHVGVVTCASPLRITHCTGPGVIVDTALGKWNRAGRLQGIDYSGAQGAGEEGRAMQALVTAPSGTTVNLRERPNAKALLIRKVGVGSTVTVEEQAEGWARVVYGGIRGYMMAQFLALENEQAEGSLEQRVATVEAWIAAHDNGGVQG